MSPVAARAIDCFRCRVKINHNNNVRGQSKLEEENFFLRTQLESLLHELHVTERSGE